MKTAEQMKRPLSKHEEERLAHLYSEKVERYLDAGFGSCYMKDERIAKKVATALMHFEGQRYNLAAWCVMPNHVHAVIQPFAGITGGTPVPRAVPHSELPDILHSWKSFTAKEANRLLGRSDDFWQAEYYDHLIRNEADFRHAVKYVLNNPIKAGLKNWKWVGLTECGTRILRVRWELRQKKSRARRPCHSLKSTKASDQADDGDEVFHVLEKASESASAEGAKCRSLGQRPRIYDRQRNQALKERNKRIDNLIP